MRALFGLLVFAAGALAEFNEKGELLFPADYREWIYLSSGLGMTYGPAASTTPANPLFDNVFVNRSAWDQFKKTGKWPEAATFVLEVRQSTSHGSINKGGAFQTTIKAIEVEVKDSKRFPRAGPTSISEPNAAPCPRLERTRAAPAATCQTERWKTRSCSFTLRL